MSRRAGRGAPSKVRPAPDSVTRPRPAGRAGGPANPTGYPTPLFPPPPAMNHPRSRRPGCPENRPMPGGSPTRSRPASRASTRSRHRRSCRSTTRVAKPAQCRFSLTLFSTESLTNSRRCDSSRCVTAPGDRRAGWSEPRGAVGGSTAYGGTPRPPAGPPPCGRSSRMSRGRRVVGMPPGRRLLRRCGRRR